MAPTLLVTGASGHLGQKVLDLLIAEGGHSIIATTRNVDKLAAYGAKGVDVRRADFDDVSSLTAAFTGADRLLLISTDAVDGTSRRQDQHANAVKAAKAAGVSHLVYTSIPNALTSTHVLAPDHKATEEAIVASGINHTILRNNFYAELLVGNLKGAIAHGTLASAAGDGRVNYLSRNEIAVAAAAAVAADFDGKRVLEINGNEPLTIAQIVELAEKAAGKTIEIKRVDAAALTDILKGVGLPEGVAGFVAAIDVSNSKGELDIKTDDFETLVGRPPQSVAAFLEAHKAELVS